MSESIFRDYYGKKIEKVKAQAPYRNTENER
jgi:hypothetical protein